jgi:hypothetical protein
MFSLYKSQILILGQTGAGKSTLLKKLIKGCPKFDFGFCFTSTPWEWSGPQFKNIITLSFDDFDKVNILFNIKLIKLKKFVIIDNFIGIFKIDKLVEKLYTQGRHFNIASFCLCQYASKITPTVRENSRYIFILRCSIKSYELLYNNQNKYNKKSDWIDFCQKNASYSPILINNNDLNLINNIILFNNKSKN